jgi:Domain of unknown function (DUF4838)
MRNCCLIAIALLTTIMGCASIANADQPLPLTVNAQSPYQIYVPANGPASIRMAGQELQAYIAKATGAKLPIVNTFPKTSVISLGFHESAKAAGLSLEGIKLEGYRIVTSGKNIFIYGIDTPDGKRTPGGGRSNGTLNGVYTFLENVLGIRWLVPGPEGEYVPNSPSVGIQPMNLIETPGFENRRVPYIRRKHPQVIEWMRRNKLGYSIELRHWHNWQSVLKVGDYRAHPDYFALMGGKRVRPIGDRYKLCTTQPGVIQAFADAAIKGFTKNPDILTYSLSPTDSAGWCECAPCQALDEVDADGKRRITRRILTFYNAVAEKVAKRFPKKYVCGYVYAAYQYPPIDKTFKVHPNAFLVWAPSMSYGMTQFTEGVRLKWRNTLKRWSDIAPNLAYYDLFNRLTQNAGAPNPPCRAILKSTMPALAESKVRGIYIYGLEAWGHAGASNYALARLAWNPKADVDALCDEFYMKAYGAGGPAMKTLYDELEDALASHMQTHPEALTYNMTNGVLKDVYAKRFARMEKLFLEATAKAKDPNAKARLAMFRDNMVKLCRWLDQFGWLPDAKKSTFYLDAKAFAEFASTRATSLSMKPVSGANAAKLISPILKRVRKTHLVVTTPKITEKPQSYRLRGSQHIILKTEEDREIILPVTAVRNRPNPINYVVWDSSGDVKVKGVIVKKGEVRFMTAGGANYHLYLQTGSGIYTIDLPNIPHAIDSRIQKRGAHFQAKITPIYFYVPKGVTQFYFTLSSAAPNETTQAKILRPDGTVAATLETVENPADEKLLAANGLDGKVWKILISKARKGYFDDIYFEFDKKLSGFFSLRPDGVLAVE